MAHRRSGFAKKIDTVHWTYGSFDALALAAGTIAVNAFPAQHLPETLLRTRGEVMVYAQGLDAPGVVASLGVGMIQVPEGTGTTVLWSPITDGDAPWIWVDYFIIGYEEKVTDVIAVQELQGARRVIDSKGMRKLRNTELQVVFENASISGALPISTAGQMRILSGS